MRSTAGILALAGALAVATASAAFAASLVLDQARAFRGRISYVVQQTDATHPVEVQGDLTVEAATWSLEERAPFVVARAGTRGASVDSSDAHVGVDDPLAAGSVANAWAIAVGTLATSSLTATNTDGIWTADRLRLYLDDSRSRVLGMADTAGAGNVSFAFDDWVEVDGLSLPRRVMRLRDGISEAAFAVSGYTVERANPASAPTLAPASQKRQIESGSVPSTAPQPAIELFDIAFPWRLLLTAFGALLFGLLVVAWTRRDALIERVRRWVEDDPRGWTTRGISAFVSPEGRLHFDGVDYRVGAQFYNRMAMVQTSPLFLRVGARDVPKAVILARQFRPHAFGASRRQRTASGFTMIETLVAVAVFATIVVGAVFPTLIVMARGDSIAATQETAVRMAANALDDEEAACAYGTVSDGSVTSQVGQLTLTVTVAPSASGEVNASDISVSVADQNGRSLARAVSTVGPAVPPPPPPNATPTPPSPTGSPPPPAPSPSPTWPG